MPQFSTNLFESRHVALRKLKKDRIAYLATENRHCMVIKQEISWQGKSIEIHLFDQAQEAEHEWTSAVWNTDVIMQFPYQALLKRHTPESLIVYFASLIFEGKVIGLMHLQRKHFNASRALNVETHGCGWTDVALNVRNQFAKLIRINGLILGNLLLTGQFGYKFDQTIISQSEETLFVNQVFEEIQTMFAQIGKQVQVYCIKDVNPKDYNAFSKYQAVQFQPNMLLHMRSNWKTFDDYLADLKSKYRRRINSAIRKFEEVEIMNLSAEQIATQIDEIHTLYTSVANKADFNLFILPKGYFIDIKRTLGDACDVNGYYIDGKLEAFQINIANGRDLEAHFLGYNEARIKSHDIYLNLLLNSLQLGIKYQKNRVNYSRTAMEIKSSIGAVPEPLGILVRHKQALLNAVLPRIASYIEPEASFHQRHPFK